MTKSIKDDILKAIREVPLISPSASQLLEISNDPDHGLVDLVNIVKHDAPLTAQLLRIVNSAAFSRRAEITSIDRALSLLGEDMVVGMVLADAASHLFDSSLEGYGGAKGDLWEHNLRSAVAAKKIAAYSKTRVNGDTSFTCGLLHDLGKAIISDYLKNTPAEIIPAIAQGKFNNYSAAEQEILGLDHAEVGLELARYWQLPEPLPSVIGYHHKPDQAPSEIKPLAYVVHLGDIIAMLSGGGTGSDNLFHGLVPEYVDYIDLNNDDLALVVIEVNEEFNRIRNSLGREGVEQ
ncbi:MAG: HDOD domain-containing protein [Proteobacteria bacterium]|nr:HDOD domain-containing protein [Pseudomonadota bacterium]MBU1717068.1 HDOD domain-containing protein [Pseudomonadota bacterium]